MKDRIVSIGGLSSETQSTEVFIHNHETGWHRTYFQLDNGRYSHVSFPIIGERIRETAKTFTQIGKCTYRKRTNTDRRHYSKIMFT